jgi:hypothetical protein
MCFALAGLVFSGIAAAQEFKIEWVDSTRPDSIVSVYPDQSFWVDQSTGDDFPAERDGDDLVLKDELGAVVAIINGGAGASQGETGTVELGNASIGTRECVEL